MSFLNSLSKKERTITPQQKEKLEYHYKQEYRADLTILKGIEIDYLHSKGCHLIRKIEIHVKHYKLGNLTKSELNVALAEAEQSITEQLSKNTDSNRALSEEERNLIAKIYYDQLDLLKAELEKEVASVKD